jgi:hypothetical protein
MARLQEIGGFILRIYSVFNSNTARTGIPSQLIILLAPLWINAFIYVLMSRLVLFFVPEKRVAGIGVRRLLT